MKPDYSTQPDIEQAILSGQAAALWLICQASPFSMECRDRLLLESLTLSPDGRRVFRRTVAMILDAHF